MRAGKFHLRAAALLHSGTGGAQRVSITRMGWDALGTGDRRAATDARRSKCDHLITQRVSFCAEESTNEAFVGRCVPLHVPAHATHSDGPRREPQTLAGHKQCPKHTHGTTIKRKHSYEEE
jgi:hypothetical protein